MYFVDASEKLPKYPEDTAVVQNHAFKAFRKVSFIECWGRWFLRLGSIMSYLMRFIAWEYSCLITEDMRSGVRS